MATGEYRKPESPVNQISICKGEQATGRHFATLGEGITQKKLKKF